MNKILLTVVLVESVIIGALFINRPGDSFIRSPVVPTEKPFLQYTYKNLRQYHPTDSGIQIGPSIRTGDSFTSYVFFFKTKDNKKVSGLINIPKADGTYPIAILIRGFVDPQNYETGIGSQRVGEYFAGHGFITLAPDFLGYGQSDKPSKDAFEDRFLTYTTVIDLLSSLKHLNAGLKQNGITNISADGAKIGIWAHSNGGQIALSVSEITGFMYPMVLWAPVSKPFPYSILYYTDEFDDNGKALRKSLAKFEESYNVEDFNPANYIDWIQAPIQLHQGINDEEVPVVWTELLKKSLEDKKKTVEYFTYPGENHNFQNGGWQLAVERSLAFFNSNIKLKEQ